MPHAPEGAGRNDRVHGDEPEIAAERESRRRSKEEWEADHWDELEDVKEE